MRFAGNSGSRVDVETLGVGGVIVSVTEAGVSPGLNSEACAVVAMVVLDVNHAEALALGIAAAVKELTARSVGL